MENSNNRTELEELGEFALIERLTKKVKLINPSSLLGIGDDAAIIKNGDKLTVVSTDILTEGVHFNLTYTPLRHLGYKAVIVNLSDIYAMNALPKQITVSIAVSNRFSVEALEEIYDGINLACKFHGVDLVGGDTTSSVSGLFISITSIGVVKEGEQVVRTGAKENDLIVVSGDLGGAYMGLQILEREREVFKTNQAIQPDLDGHDYILQRQLKPEARKDIIETLRLLDVLPTSMIDISDGLASEITHLCKQSKVGCNIYDEKIPIDPSVINTAEDFNLDPSMCALNGGEDYELLFTIKQSDFNKIRGNPHLSVIGHITDANNGINLITRDGNQYAIKSQGWNAFGKNT
jgi:thiamine-monophosphate kinase